jgi:hypothetical protein
MNSPPRILRMRTIGLLALVVILAACGSSTEPQRANVSLAFTNLLDTSWVYITWQNGMAISGRDSIPPRTNFQCVRFFAQPDSAYWQIKAHENGSLGTVTAPFFNPPDRPAWKVLVLHGGSSGSPLIEAWDKMQPPPSYAVDNPVPC